MTLTISDFEVSDLNQLDPDSVNQVLERLITQLQAQNPTLDLKRGVFKDTLATYHAILETAIRTDLERYQSARSLQQIEADPSLADDTVVDEVLSNFGVTRREGTLAEGSVAIELSASRTVVVPAGSTFEANGLSYSATATFTARTSAAQVVTANDRLLSPLSNGNYLFVIEVQATAVGPEYKLEANELIIPNRSLANFVTSYATSTFSEGVATQTNAELITSLQEGIAAKTLSNRVNMRAWLGSYPEFSSVTNQSIVGYGDAEMLRDQHTVFPVSFGGRVDWYVRGQQQLERLAATVLATLVSKEATSSTWQFSVSKTLLPAFYEITKIRRAADSVLNSGFEVTQDLRVNDLTGSEFVPDIQTVAEGTYTAYQTSTIRFSDTVTDVSAIAIGSTASYACELVGTTLISEIQALVVNRDHRSYAADALIKAPVPCFVKVSMTINKASGDPEPDVDSIKSAIVDIVNQTGFIGRLDGSRIVEAAHAFIQGNVSITDLDLLGRIRQPSGDSIYLRDADSLVVREDPINMVTAKTVQFFAEVSDISVDVTSDIPIAS
jgi:hypothetical protein